MSERQNENFRRWYQLHREEHLAERRKRMKTDPDFAASRRASGNKYVENNRDAINADRRARVASDPEYKASLAAYSEVFRERVKSGHIPNVTPKFLDVDGKPVRAYRQSEAARRVPCSDAAIVKWLRDGWLPEPQKQNGRRLFTEDQICLIAWFASINPHDFDERSRVSKKIWEIW